MPSAFSLTPARRNGWRPLLLAGSGLTLLAAALYGPARPVLAQQRPNGSEFVPTFSTNTRVKQQVDRLQRVAGQKLWDEWLSTYQGLVDDPSDPVLERDAEFLVGVRYWAHQQMAGLPAAVRAKYRTRYDAEAGKLYDKAAADGDLTKMREVYSRYRFTVAGPRALLWMANRALDEGRPEFARVAYSRIAKDPAVSVNTLIRYALACDAAGKGAEARQVLERVKKEFAAQPVQLAGQGTSGAGAADRLLKELRKDGAGGAGPRWTGFSGDGQRRMTAAPAATSLAGLKKRWSLPYSSVADSSGNTGKVQTTFSSASRNRFSFLGFPVVSGGALWIQGPRNLTRVDLEKGQATWDRQGADFVLNREEMPTAAPAGGRSTLSSRTTRAIQGLPVLSGQRLVTRLPLGSAEGSGFQTFPSDFGIGVHDARTGTMLWRRVAGGDPRGVYWNSPTVEADTVLTGYWNDRGGITEYTAVALDAATGETLWSTYLGAGTDPFNGTDGSAAVVKDGTVWIESTLYTLNALDLLSGEVRLIYRYDPSRRNSARINGFEGSAPVSNEPISLLAAGSGPIVFCPRWGLDVVALDAATGKLLWSSPKASGTSMAGSLFGVDSKRVYIGGDHLQAISLEDGARDWTWEPSGTGSTSGISFPALVGDRIYTLTDGKLTARSTTDGKEVETVDLTESVGDQAGYSTITAVDNLLVICTRDRVVVLEPK